MSNWNEIMGEVANELPDFNDDLLINFRKDKVEGILHSFDEAYKQAERLFRGEMKYIGRRPLTPQERIEYIQNNMIIGGSVNIRKTNMTIYRFEFEYKDKIYKTHLSIPYMENMAIVFDDVVYYPLFPIIERGGIHRLEDEVKIKVMLVPITIWRKDLVSARTEEGTLFQDINISVKIYQGSGMKKKKYYNTPVVLYHFIKWGYEETLKVYGFKANDIDIVSEVNEHKDFLHIRVSTGIFIRFKKSVTKDMRKSRVIVSLLRILQQHKKFNIEEAKTSKAFYQVALGKYVCPISKQKDPRLLYNNADAHIKTVDVMLDPPAQKQLASVGINVSNIYELLFQAFYLIDTWVNGSEYNPIDLYDKKIGCLDTIMNPVTRRMFNNQFKIINNERVGLNPDNLEQFMKSSSSHDGWFTKDNVFRVCSSIYNDNWLLTIGGKKIRSMENTENSNGKKKKTNLPCELLKSHPSQLVVESLLAIPTSSPVISGTINPYLKVDNDGRILKPDYASEIDHLFS